jgi:hypothetical protein
MDHLGDTDDPSVDPDSLQQEKLDSSTLSEDWSPDKGSSDSSPSALPISADTEARAMEAQNVNNTGANQENQAQTPPPRTRQKEAELDLADRLARRQRKLEAILFEKETGMLNYVFHRFAKPYYLKFKVEANESFHLAVLNRRRLSKRFQKPSNG